MYFLYDYIQFDYTLKLNIKRHVYARKYYKNMLDEIIAEHPSLRVYTIQINSIFKLDDYYLEMLKLSERQLNKRIEKYVKNQDDYIKLNFYDLNRKRTDLKNQVYANNKYLLTTDKLNNENVEFDYNLFRIVFNRSQEDVKEILQFLYTARK